MTFQHATGLLTCFRWPQIYLWTFINGHLPEANFMCPKSGQLLKDIFNILVLVIIITRESKTLEKLLGKR